ncbi:MAG TPA: glycosyltransferase family 2 protein [Chthoniobacterales bacterium]|jgi:glycosyltransferase involved in cell wall biosynthesis
MTTFSVVTPSFRQADWLRLALRSVADQATADSNVEHIVQDACSPDGTAELLTQNREVRAFIEKDDGMYDAINRGLRRATGEIVSYLNCDEQYLSGALQKVAEFFAANPTVDVLFAGLIIIDDEGNYICSRKVLPPLAAHTRVCHLSTFTCSTFFRRRILQDGDLYFDATWKAAGDAEWILRCLKKGLRMAALPDLTSVFVDTGANLGATPTSEEERERLYTSAPKWQQKAVPLVALHHRLRRWVGGVYRQAPFRYSIYTLANPNERTSFEVPRPTTLWKQRFTLMR